MADFEKHHLIPNSQACAAIPHGTVATEGV